MFSLGVFSFQSLAWDLNWAPSEMSDEDDTKQTDNVVRLGTETLFAIGDELRRMYEADLRSKPSVELERLIDQIERGEEINPPPQPVKVGREPPR